MVALPLMIVQPTTWPAQMSVEMAAREAARQRLCWVVAVAAAVQTVLTSVQMLR